MSQQHYFDGDAWHEMINNLSKRVKNWVRPEVNAACISIFHSTTEDSLVVTIDLFDFQANEISMAYPEIGGLRFSVKKYGSLFAAIQALDAEFTKIEQGIN